MIVVGATILSAGLSKLFADPPNPSENSTVFARLVNNAATRIAFFVLQVLTVIALFTPRLRQLAAFSILGFLSLATGLLIQELRSPNPVPCGCFNASRAMRGDEVTADLKRSVGRNLGLMLCSVAILSFQRSNAPEVP